MTRTTVAILVDGLDPDYLQACETPHLQEIAQKGFLRIGRGVMPSVTNVNNVSLVTASYPQRHGICSNYRFIPDSGEGVYMESSEFILAETMFRAASRKGLQSALVTSKDKLRTLLGEDATFACSSEQPPQWLVNEIGSPPPIYSVEVNGWSVRAADRLMREHPLDLVYISTTDYAMHRYAPDEPEAQRHLAILDEAIGDLLDHHPDATLLLTADHGMSAKHRMVDLRRPLAERGISAVPLPIIKDRYTVHHSNLGGCMFVHLAKPRQLDEALDVLREESGVDEALSREAAAERYRLHPDRIGDIMVNGAHDTVFGDPSEVEMPPGLRSHASTYELDVPILGYNGEFDGFTFQENRDVGRYIFQKVLAS